MESDPIEDGQAECQKCGEWYHLTAPFGGHDCPRDKEHRRVARLTPAEWMRGGKQIERAPMLDEEGAPDEH